MTVPTSKVLKKIEDDVTCPVCLEKFEAPKILQCHHEFCKKCLICIAEKNKEFETITCPKCNQKTTLDSKKGIDGLQTGLFAQRFLELEKTLRRSEKKIVSCELHEGEKISMYCEPCKRLICSKCAIEAHNGHQYKQVRKVSEECKQELSTGLEKASKVQQKMESLTTKFEKREQELLAQQSKLESQINDLAKKLQQAIETKRKALLTDVQTLSSTKLKSLNRKLTDLKRWQSRLEDSMNAGECLLSDGRDEIVISGSDKSLDLMNKTCASFRQASIYVHEEANVGVASGLESALQSIDNFASITTCKSCPPKCYARGTGLSSGTVGEERAVTVFVMDKKTQPCSRGSMNEVEFKIEADIEGRVASGVASRVKENQYEFSYTPKYKGYHQISITIRDQHIYGSPFQVAVKSSLSSIGIPISSITTVQNSCALTTNLNGEILILSETVQAIHVIKQNGVSLREIPLSDIFSDISLSDDGIYIVNATRNQAVKLSPDGTPLYTSIRHMSLSGSGPLKFNNPRGIAFNPKNKKVYISNTNNHEIQVLNGDLTHYKTIGKEGNGKLQFKFPRGICCDDTGRVYVADSINDRVQVLTADGKFVRAFGQSGEEPGCLKCPMGVAIDVNKHVYVSERTNNRVSVFGPNGNILKCFGAGGDMESPTGIAVDDNCGTVLVCNYGDNSIQVY